MPKTVHIPKVGHVEFPDEMDDNAIGKAAAGLHSNARAEGISTFMGQDPAIQGLPHSQKLKELSAISALMEKYPRLAHAVDTGIEALTSQGESQASTAPGQQEAEAQQPPTQ